MNLRACRKWQGQYQASAERGFTLIELLVVFTLLALLLGIAVPRYLQTADASREKVREQNMATLRDALDKFKADQGRYPTVITELVSKQYLRRLPLDPVTGSTQWNVVADPTGTNPGVYDVAPPVGAPTDAPTVSSTDSVQSSPLAPASSSVDKVRAP